MADQEIVEIFLGTDKFKKSKEEVLTGLDQMISKISEVGKLRTDLGFTKGISEFQKALNQLKPALDGMETSTSNVSKASKELAQAQLAEAKATEQNIKVKKQQVAADNEVVKQIILEEKAQQESIKTQKLKRQETETTNKVKAAESKQIKQLSNDYYQLNQAYRDQVERVRALALQGKENTEVFKQEAKSAQDMYAVLLRVDQVVGNNTRNVGNYKSHWDGLGMSFTQIARELPSLTISVQQFALAISNNLPMLADEIGKAKVEIAALKAEGQAAPSLFNKIAGAMFSWQVGLSIGITLLTAFSGQIADWIGGLIKGKEKIEQIAASAKVLDEAFASSGLKQAKVNVLELRNEIELAKEGFISKTAVVEHYNDTIGKTAGQVKTLDEAEQALSKNADAYIQFTLLKAAANLALEKSAEQILTSQVKQREFDRRLKEGVVGRQAKQDLFALSATVGGAKMEADKFDKVATDLFAKASEIAKKFNFSFFGTAQEDDKKAKEREKKAKDFANRQLKAEFELYKASLEHQAKYFESISNNEKLSFTQRSTALELYTNLHSQIISAEMEFELKSEKLGSKERQKIKGEGQIKLIELEHQTQKKLNEILQQGIAERKAKEEQDKQDRITQAEAKTSSRVLRNQTLQNDELRRLDDDFLSGKIKKVEDYEKAKAELTAKWSEKIFQDQIDALQKELNMEGLSAEKREQIENKISELKKSRSAETTQKQIEDINKLKEAEIRLAEKRKELIEELKNLIEEAILGSIENEKNALQHKQDISNENYEKELSNIQNSSLAEADKANRIKILEAEQKARNEKFEREKRELIQKQAKFEKAFAIASIIQSTAVAVVAALRPPPVGLGPVAGIPLAAITAAIGAAQIAAIVARPIPKYAEGAGVNGKPEHKGGLAIVGEGKNAELVSTPDGKSFIADKPTLLDLPAYSKVLPLSDDLDASMYQSMLKGTARSLLLSNAAEASKRKKDNDLSNKLDLVVMAIKSNKPPKSKGISKEVLRSTIQLEQAKNEWRRG
jgi:hypothetical protein